MDAPILRSACRLAPRWSGRAFFLLAQSLDLALLEDGTEALRIACDHRQGDVALEAVDAVIETDVQTMNFQRVDGRLDRRVLAAQTDEFGLGFERLVRLRELALAR